MVVAILGLALIAHAAISSIQPASAEGEPGDTVSAVVTVSTSGLTSCLSATSEIPLVITFDGLTTTCGTGTWFSTMEVTIPATTPPGTYTVTINEVTLGGSLLGSYPWPLVVSAPPTNTTLLPDPTLLTPTTEDPTTTEDTTTTTEAATTTEATTTTEGVATNSTTSTSSTGSAAPNATSTTGEEESSDATSTTPPARIDGADTAVAPTAAGEPSSSIGVEPFSEIALTSGLIEVADRALPPVFAQAVLSPFVILEVLLRALSRTTGGLLLPLGVTILAGFGLARRLRRDAAELPELDDLVEIPDDREEDHST